MWNIFFFFFIITRQELLKEIIKRNCWNKMMQTNLAGGKSNNNCVTAVAHLSERNTKEFLTALYFIVNRSRWRPARFSCFVLYFAIVFFFFYSPAFSNPPRGETRSCFIYLLDFFFFFSAAQSRETAAVVRGVVPRIKTM